MANTLGYYNPYFYAQEALIQLEKALGMAARVHRGYDAERRTFRQGEYVNIRRPSTFTATDVNTATAGTTADVTTESVQVQLSNWKEVKFELTDKELAFTGERIIDEHIRPAAYALADVIDQALTALYVSAAGAVDVATSTAIAATDITDVWRQMFNNKVPMNELDRMHFMVDGKSSKELLDLTAFTSYNVAGSNAEMGLMRGNLGQRYGFNFFSNQNVASHTAGTADSAAAVDLGAGYDPGDSTIHMDGLDAGETLKAGDSVQFANHNTTYVVTTDVTFTAGEADVVIAPKLTDAVVDDEVVTILNYTGPANLAFHRNFCALVTAPLSDMGNELGAKVAAVQDPITGLSLRSRIWYEADYSKVKVGLDVLYGVKCLDEALGCKLINIP